MCLITPFSYVNKRLKCLKYCQASSLKSRHISMATYCFHVSVLYQGMFWQSVSLCSDSTSSEVWCWIILLCAYHIDRVIRPDSGRRMRNWENDYMLTQDLSRNPFHSRPVPSLPAALSGSRDDICFLHPSSLIHKAKSVSLHSALTASSLALLLQLMPPRHAVGAGDSLVIIVEVGMECPLFQCSDFALCLNQGWSQLFQTTVAATSYARPGSG